MKKLKSPKSKERLFTRSTTFFIGNRNQIRYYVDTLTDRNYCEARFDYDETAKRFRRTAWYQLNKNDIKDEDAQMKTELEINMDFGYFRYK